MSDPQRLQNRSTASSSELRPLPALGWHHGRPGSVLDPGSAGGAPRARLVAATGLLAPCAAIGGAPTAELFFPILPSYLGTFKKFQAGHHTTSSTPTLPGAKQPLLDVHPLAHPPTAVRHAVGLPTTLPQRMPFPRLCPALCPVLCPALCLVLCPALCPVLCPALCPVLCPALCPVLCPALCLVLCPAPCPVLCRALCPVRYPVLCPRLCPAHSTVRTVSPFSPLISMRYWSDGKTPLLRRLEFDS